MNYLNMTKDEMISKMEDLEMMINQLLGEKEEENGIDYAWTGNLGHWYLNLKTNFIKFNPLKATALGYTKEEIPEDVPYQFFTDRLHPEDYENAIKKMMDYIEGRSNVYEVEYRIRAKDGSYKWYFDRGSIAKRDEKGRPILLAGIAFDITKNKELLIDLEARNKILVEQSCTDGLTQIKNHRSLIESLKREIENSIINGCPVSIAMFDLDNFKKINDKMGHVFGDQVLVAVAQSMQNNVRKTDCLGRYGGEEFMIVFSNTTHGIAKDISERIRKAIENLTFEGDIKVTISGGVTEFKGEEICSLIHLADMNLYKAKEMGKNKVI